MNVQLIQSLNAEHAQLASILSDIKNEGSLTPKALEKISQVKSALISHLAHEDRDFYPVMKQEANINPSLAQLLEVMGRDMNDIAEAALSQIAAWEKGEGKERFTQDCSSLISVLSDRIKREEHSLYAKYLKLVL